MKKFLFPLFLSHTKSNKLYRNPHSHIFLSSNALIACLDYSFKRTSPFHIAKTFPSVIGDDLDHMFKELLSGYLLVEVSSTKQSHILSNSSTIGLFCSGTSNSKYKLWFYLWTRSFIPMKDQVLKNFKDQNIIDACHITIRRNEQVFPTKHIILTFNSSTLSTRIKAAYLNCPVWPYIPNPFCCFRYQRYGHTKPTPLVIVRLPVYIVLKLATMVNPVKNIIALTLRGLIQPIPILARTGSIKKKCY